MLTYGLVAKWHRWLAFSIFPDSQTADYWIGLLIHLTKPLKISELVNSLVVICEGTWWVLVVHTLTLWPLHLNTTHCAIVCLLQHVTMEDSYLCGYLKIKGLTEVKWSRTGSDTVYFSTLPLTCNEWWCCHGSLSPFWDLIMAGVSVSQVQCGFPAPIEMCTGTTNQCETGMHYDMLKQQARASYWPICNTSMKAYVTLLKCLVWALYTVFGCLILHWCVDWLPDCL